jgi:hypothetical protein
MAYKWIRVKDRLPLKLKNKKYVNINVLSSDGEGVYSGEFECGGLPEEWYNFRDEEGYKLSGITHWMPYPEPPEAK